MLIESDAKFKELKDIGTDNFRRGRPTRIRLPYEVLGIDINEFCSDGFDPEKLQLRITKTSLDHNGYEGWTRGEYMLYSNMSSYCFALGDSEMELSFLTFVDGTWITSIGYPFELGHIDGKKLPEEKVSTLDLLQRPSNMKRKWYPEVNERISGFNDAAYMFAIYLGFNLANGREEILSLPSHLVMRSLFESEKPEDNMKKDGLRKKYDGTARILGLLPYANPKTGKTSYYYVPKNYDPSSIRKELLNPDYFKEKRRKQ
ncbi:MAG: hypothetical protein JW754_05680 [Candidatus Aenigmarchaeota archaeon]|nr:hypothetical protein [Candidatus Aenigmarchaeota archaeon]